MDNNNFDLITILLIEDNPSQEGIKARDLMNRGKDIGDINHNAPVPGIFFTQDGKQELHKLFELKVLQHIMVCFI